MFYRVSHDRTKRRMRIPSYLLCTLYIGTRMTKSCHETHFNFHACTLPPDVSDQKKTVVPMLLLNLLMHIALQVRC